jgi:Flp pilus assembly protein TadB
MSKVIINLKLNNTPIASSLSMLGESLDVDELSALGSTISTAKMTGGDLCSQLRHQSESLRYRLRAEEAASQNVARNFGDRSSRPYLPPPSDDKH